MLRSLRARQSSAITLYSQSSFLLLRVSHLSDFVPLKVRHVTFKTDLAARYSKRSILSILWKNKGGIIKSVIIHDMF